MEQTKLHQRIGEAGAEPNVNGEGSSRKGFMGHLAALATSVHSASEVNSQLEDVLETCDVWKKYMQADFATIKKIESILLGSTADSGDAENREIDQLVRCFRILMRFYLLIIRYQTSKRLLSADLKMISQILSHQAMMLFSTFSSNQQIIRCSLESTPMKMR